ncbi:MAG: response regulator transcription factor [Acidobacteriota bacterium]|nr:response regulator transcription factor [Acidobacteriota bacterium]
MRILLVEDDEMIATAIEEALVVSHYAVDRVSDGVSADEAVAVNGYDAIVLDWGIPDPSGIELLRQWRAKGISTPVLMLTGRSDVVDRVDGLDSGADDYLTKPFAVAELLARVRSLIRRRERSLFSTLAADDVEMDRAARRVTVGGEPIELSPKEFGLLEYLLYHVDEVVTRTDISEHVWDDSFDAMSNVIDVTIHRLRRKIDGDRPGALLRTVKGVGYLLASARAES